MTQKELAERALAMKQAARAEQAEADDSFLPARCVWERYHVSEMTLFRWLREETMGFPRPIYFGRFRYWRVSDLVAWERRRAAEPPPKPKPPAVRAATAAAEHAS
jgi:predicted DNA-binding transcriptional regulator AlpA